MKAAGLTALAYVLSTVIRFGGNLVLTRILAPEIFGVMSVVLAVQTILALFSDVGLRPSVVQSVRGDDPKFLNTVWVLQIIRGLLIFAVSVAIAAGLWVAGTYGLLPEGAAISTPELPLLIAAISFSALIQGFQSTNVLSAMRRMAVGRVVALELFTQVLGVAAAIMLALELGTAWAMVISAIVASVATAVLSYVIFPGIRNKPEWDGAAFREIWRFGIWLTLSSICFVLASNVDRLILAAAISPALLGLYSLAFNILVLIETALATIVNNILFPRFSELARSGEARLAASVMAIRKFVDPLIVMAAGGLFSLAPTLMAFLYDDRYHEAGAILQVLSFALIFGRYQVLGAAFLAVGESHLYARLSAVKLVSVFLFFVLPFYLFGFDVALYGMAFHSIPSALLNVYRGRQLGFSTWQMELLPLLAWPVGYALGETVLAVLAYI